MKQCVRSAVQREFTIPTDLKTNKSPVQSRVRRDSQRCIVHPPFTLELGVEGEGRLYKGGGFGIGKQGVLKGLQGGFMIEVDADEHELRAGGYTIGGP